MNPLAELAKSLVSGGGSSRDWLWACEEGALTRHLATRSPESLNRRYSPQTADELLSVQGDTAVIRVHGVMLQDPAWSDEVSTPAIEAALHAAAGDEGIKSILLDVDSPGGSASGLVQLARAVAAAKAQKPVVGQSRGMIASAAYFLCAQCDKIYADRGHLVGSIGTRLHVFDFSQLFSSIGIKSIPIDTGPLKSAGALGTELSDEQREYFQSIVDGFQSEFTAVVKQGRGFDADQYAAVATGGVFHVAEARKLGLIDGIRTPQETLAAMPKRRSSQPRSQDMSDTNTNTQQTPPAEKPATMAQLKKEFPKASSDFLCDQLEAEATLGDAHRAYSAFLIEENERIAAEKAEAEEKAAKLEEEKAKLSQSGATRNRGNRPQATSEDGDEEPTDYKAMARDYMKQKSCSYRQACFAIKRQYPEAREAFKGEPLPL